MRAEEFSEKMAAALEKARLFLTADKYKPRFSDLEREVLRPFFTSIDGRVFFIHSLPEAVVDVLLAMYSRLKNTRGLRGIFVDAFLPHVLASMTSEVSSQFNGKAEAFLKHYNINSLDKFTTSSPSALSAYREFRDALNINPEYIQKIASSPRIKAFLKNWLDKYGHNSIARIAKLSFGAENISILAAKSLEWTRPGSGYIELSTRYVDMSGKDLYPIEEELEIFGIPKDEVKFTMEQAFDYYRALQGGNFSGPFPNFLRQTHSHLFEDKSDLENGVIGETCDVLGNFLPCATLTSVGVSASGEAFPQILKHLILDATPENLVLVDMIAAEASKIGADQFIRHSTLTEWDRASWQYFDAERFARFNRSGIVYQLLPCSLEESERVLEMSFSNQPRFGEPVCFADIVKRLKNLERSEFDKLPNHFELISAAFSGVMSFRSWRDLQRQQLATHFRTYVTPYSGFYRYDKPAPEELFEARDAVQHQNADLYRLMAEKGITPELMQYPLAMGNLVGFQIGANLLEFEFCIWQRTKFSVNHEVRRIFLDIEKILRMAYPWWSEISRADTCLAYVFARTKTGVPLDS